MGFLSDWLTGWLSYLGLYKKTGKLLLLGLDHAGKTTLLRTLKDGHLSTPHPTLHPTSEVFTLGGIELTTFDVGGHRQVRRVWKNYFQETSGIIFIIDVSDTEERKNEALAEFRGLLLEETLRAVPIVILGNKIDKDGAISEEQLRYELGVYGCFKDQMYMVDNKLTDRPVELFMTCITKHQGYKEGIHWLASFI